MTNRKIRGAAMRAVVSAALLSSALSVAAQPTLPAQPPTLPTTDPAKPPARRPDPPKQTLDAVKVTGQRDVVEERRVSTATKIIISRDDIEQYGDSNLGEVMRRLPGVTSGGRPGRGGAPRMRGMGGGFTQILIDGERIPPGFSVEQITPEQVERIEILRAPTAETGTRAIAGTINIILREPLRARHNEVRGGVQSERGRSSPNLSWTRNDSFSPTGTYNFTVSLGRNDQLTDSANRTTSVATQSGAVGLDQRGFTRANERRDSLFASSRLQWRLGQGEQFTLQPFLVRSHSRNRTEGTLEQLQGPTRSPYARQSNDFDGRVGVTRLTTMINRRFDQDTRWELRANVGQLSSTSELAPMA